MAGPSRDWDAVLETLGKLITFKNRADAGTWRDAFENMATYVERLGMTEDLKKLSVVHVAGTKGKGSTCAMVESMLRRCGYRTGLFTSPHLIDVRERVRIGGLMVDKAVFQEHFWWCYDRFEAAATPDVGVPGYFRFMTLLALKIFQAQGVDVVILEVGIGGRLDATNIVARPVVCGITSLGMDHMEMLGDTLPKIAREKAGILKPGCPSFTVPQPDDAMEALQECAAKAGTRLVVVEPLGAAGGIAAPPSVALGGAHMLVNAGLAVQLAAQWERGSEVGRSNPAAAARLAALERNQLPSEYAKGLQLVQWPGRSQVVHDVEFTTERPAVQESSAPDAAATTDLSTGSSSSGSGSSSSGSGSSSSGSRLTFFIDGAHTPESMVTCADWFAEQAALGTRGGVWDVRRVLLFNCMKERDPAVLLPALSHALCARGLSFHHALFVPPDSRYGILPTCKKPAPEAAVAGADAAAAAAPIGGPFASAVTSGAPAAAPTAPDLSWQAQMQQMWESQRLGASGSSSNGGSGHAGAGTGLAGASSPPPPPLPLSTLASSNGASPRQQDPWSGAVLPSLTCSLEWLRQYSRSSPRVQVQVLVTGSLYLVGDVLRLLGKVPK